MSFIRVQVVQPQFKINPIFLIRDQISIWLLTCQYIDCIYHYCQVRTSDILKLYLVASYFCVDSGESLLRWLWSEYTPSKEEYVTQFAALLFTSCLLIDNLVVLLSYLGRYKSVVCRAGSDLVLSTPDWYERRRKGSSYVFHYCLTQRQTGWSCLPYFTSILFYIPCITWFMIQYDCVTHILLSFPQRLLSCEKPEQGN